MASLPTVGPSQLALAPFSSRGCEQVVVTQSLDLTIFESSPGILPISPRNLIKIAFTIVSGPSFKSGKPRLILSTSFGTAPKPEVVVAKNSLAVVSLPYIFTTSSLSSPDILALSSLLGQPLARDSLCLLQPPNLEEVVVESSPNYSLHLCNVSLVTCRHYDCQTQFYIKPVSPDRLG